MQKHVLISRGFCSTCVMLVLVAAVYNVPIIIPEGQGRPTAGPESCLEFQ